MQSIFQLAYERQFVLQETNILISQLQRIIPQQQREEVEKQLGLFREKMESLSRNQFERFPNDIALEVFSKADFECLGRLSQTCKRFRRLISSNKDKVWKRACLDWWRRTRVGEDVSPLLTAREHCEKDWEWIARCFAEDEKNMLSCDWHLEPLRLKIGMMRDEVLEGYGVKIQEVVTDENSDEEPDKKSYSVQVGYFHETILRGKEIDECGVYEGQFRRGLADGKGTLTDIKGVRESGDWKDGLKHGTIRTTFNGGRMESEYEEGILHGKTKIVMDDGFCHEGIFEDGMPKGKCCFILTFRQTQRLVCSPKGEGACCS